MNSISVLLEIAKFAGFWLKNGRTQGVCHVINIFLDLLQTGKTVSKFIIVGCV